MRMLRAIAAMILLSQVVFAGEKASFKIEGMTCGSCVSMIKAKVCKLEGVEACEVKVGEMTLTSKSTLNLEKIKQAVVSAGEYKITSEKVEKN